MYDHIFNLNSLNNMTGTFSASILSEIAGLSTAPLGGQTSALAGSTTPAFPTISASSSPTSASSSTPSATKSASGAMNVKAGWAGVAFGAIVGVAMFWTNDYWRVPLIYWLSPSSALIWLSCFGFVLPPFFYPTYTSLFNRYSFYDISYKYLWFD